MVGCFQMRPSYHPGGLFNEDKVKASSSAEESKGASDRGITQLWHGNGKCPENTVPIRRTKKADVLRASSIKRYGRKKHRAVPQPRSADPGLTNTRGHQVHHEPILDYCLLKYGSSFWILMKLSFCFVGCWGL